MFPHAQKYQQLQRQKASVAPSMAANNEDFSTLSVFGINALRTSPNLIGKNFPSNEFGVNARPSQVWVGENTRDFPRMRKRGREEDEEEEEMVHSNVLMDSHQQVLPTPNSIPTGAGISPLYNLLCLPDDPDSDLSLRMQKDLLELDLFISAQMEMVRAEVEQKRRHQWGGMARAVEDALQRAVRARDEEIASVARRNSALEERVGALAMEGQMWRTLAETNEVAASGLRRDIDLAQKAAAAAGEGGGARRGGVGGGSGEVGDSVSCCEGRPEEEEEEEEEEEWDGGRGRCRVCRREEVSTLVLPCRHLCLCGECDPVTAACPLCRSLKSASIKVQLL